jgi:membrane-associated phospholipid phosphatase
MFPIRVKPASFDRDIAEKIANHTDRVDEKVAQALTWAGDEQILIGAAIGLWLISRGSSRRFRTAANQLLAAAIVTGAVPHVAKHAFNQRRPDRLTAIGHLHGVPIQGRTNDAFPSGHAMHMGALASAASEFPRPLKAATWTATVGISLTRIFTLAHWTSDVIVGFASGFIIERALRPLTGYGREKR